MINPAVLPIANGFYKSHSLPISHQECVNLYPYLLQSPGLNQETLIGCPGIEEHSTATGTDPEDANRGGHRMGDIAYFVNGGTLYQVDSDGTTTSRGSIDGDGRVSFADNGAQMLLLVKGLAATPSSKGYIYTAATTTLAAISDADFVASGNPEHVVFIDGYFVCSTDEKKFIISSLNDGTAWNALDFGTAEAEPDAISTPAVLNNQLYMIGTETIEEFYNQPAGADFPFVRTGTFADKGTKSPYSVVKMQSRIYFVGGGRRESPAVWSYGGTGMPERISTDAIDTVLQALTEAQLSNVFAWTYSQKGFYFIGFTLPTTCLVYEIGSARWHERKSRVTYQDGSVDFTRFRVNSIVNAYGKLLVGDSVDGRIGSMDIDIYSEYDEVMKWSFSTQPFQNYMKSVSVPSLELTMESGVGNANNTDPQVELQKSVDGRTWTEPLLRSIGKVGEYNVRQIWNRIGRAPRFQAFRFSGTTKVKIVIIQLTAMLRMNRK